MKDVFKYLRQVSKHLKEGAAEDAAEMGLEYAGYGKWRDPKTGSVTHKSEKQGGETRLQALAKPEGPQDKQGGPQDQKKTLRDVRKDQQLPKVRGDLARAAKDRGEEALAAAKNASQGMWPHFSDERKEFHIQQQLAMMDAADAEAEAAEAEQLAQAEEEEAKAEEEAAKAEDEKIDKELDREAKKLDIEAKKQDIEAKKREMEAAEKESAEPDDATVELVAKALGGSKWERMDAPQQNALRDQAREAIKNKDKKKEEPKKEEPKKEEPKKKTLKDFQKSTPKKEAPKKKEVKKEAPPKPAKMSLADRMAQGFDRNVAMDLRDEANIDIDPADPDSIFVPQPVPQGEMNSVAVSSSTPSPIPPEPGEGMGEYDLRKDDDYAKVIYDAPVKVPKGERRADVIFGDSKKTDLIGESAYMEAALKIFDGSYDTDVLQMVGEKNLKPEDKKKVDDLLEDIRSAIPSKGLNKGWEESAARMVKLTTQHMDPNRKYKFGKSGDGREGMRLTTVPDDMQDFTYDRANSLLQDKIGKTKLKDLLGNDTAGIMDHYDPTDVVFFAEDAIEPFVSRLETLSDEYDNGNEKTRDQDLLNGIRTLKQEFMADRSLLPISLKKPKKGADPHFIPRNISPDYDKETMEKVSFDLMTEGKDGMTWGFDGKRMGDLTDNFAMNFNMKDDVYAGNKFSMPVINHPGTGPHANDPFARVANIKSEPSLKGGADAKLGMLDTNWIGNEKVNEILGYNFEEKYGNRDDNLGIGEGKRKGSKSNVKFSDEDRKILKNLVNEVANHEGNAKVNMKFPPGMDAEGFVDALLDADSMIHDELEGKVFRKGKRGQDAMDFNLDDEQKKRVKETLGSIPDANFRSKVRTKFRQLRYAKLLQELEKAGKLGDFGKEYIYKNTMKIGNEYSPYILLG